MRIFGSLLLIGFFPFASALADNTQTALNEIAGFAQQVCQTPPMKSSSNELELSGQANAELKGLVTKIAGLGIAGAAKYKNAESEGVLQKDLAPLLTKSADCREHMAMRLIEILLKPTPPTADAQRAQHDPDTIYQHGEPVGHVTGADPRLNQSEVYFASIKDTQNLDRSRDFQYRKWVLRLKGVAGPSAGMALTDHGPEMAVLPQVTCMIVGSAHDPDEP